MIPLILAVGFAEVAWLEILLRRMEQPDPTGRHAILARPSRNGLVWAGLGFGVITLSLALYLAIGMPVL